jgi:hypothetical protein
MVTYEKEEKSSEDRSRKKNGTEVQHNLKKNFFLVL